MKVIGIQDFVQLMEHILTKNGDKYVSIMNQDQKRNDESIIYYNNKKYSNNRPETYFQVWRNNKKRWKRNL